MRRTLQDQIAANQRASFVYSAMLVVVLAALGSVTSAYYGGEEYWWVGGAGAGLLGVVLAMVAWYAGPSIVLSISQARQATDLERRTLDNVAEEMAIAAGIPKPQVHIIDDSAPNAFATGRDPKSGVVVFTTGLIQKLDRDELQGVMAHEIAHIRNYDIRLMTVLSIVAGLVPLLADFLMRSMWWGAGRRGSRDRDGAGAIIVVIGLLFAILAPIFAKLLELAVSRQREYLADATAAELTRFPDGLARALEKISKDQEVLEVANRATEHMYIVNPFKPFEDRAASLFSTHPPLEDRVRRLRNLMGVHRPELVDPTG